jgi:ABC-type spermidine/putrescine transport system permease subunit II
MKAKLSLAAILSTTAIASGILFTSVGSAQPCSLSKYRNEQTSQGNWLQSPWAAVLTVPGIALAVSLYVRGRSYQN